MKCVKTKSGEITRVDDIVADKMVRSGEATFIPRSEWKKNNPEHKERSKQEAARKAKLEAQKAK